MNQLQQEQNLNRIKKRAPSREKCEEVRRIAVLLGTDTPDGALLEEVTEFLLDVRQALRGGRRNIKGSRHWPEDDPTLN